MAEADTEIEAVAAELVALKISLNAAYWQDATVCQLQDRLRRLLGSYDAWGEDKPAMHRRARQAAAYQARFARLLWPGGDED